MIIIAVDPGPEQSAMVWWDGKEVLRHEILKNEDLLQTLLYLGDGTLVIEMVASYGMAVGKTVFETVFWIGRFYQASPIPTELVYRKEIKEYFCHSMRAKDSNIRASLIDRFGEPGTKKDPGLAYGIKKDEWQAWALAVFQMDKQSTQERRKE